MTIDLTITARNDGTTDADGMKLGELRRALDTLVANGGDDHTPLAVVSNRAHRVRTVSATVAGTTAPEPTSDPRTLAD